MTANHLPESPVSFLTVANKILDLSHQEPLSGSLDAATLVFDDLSQIRNGFLVVTQSDVVVGIGVVPVLHSPEVHGVTTHVTDHVLCIVFPSQLGIAFGKPGPGKTIHQWLRLVESAHIREGGCCLVESSLLELSLAQ